LLVFYHIVKVGHFDCILQIQWKIFTQIASWFINFGSTCEYSITCLLSRT